MFLRLFYTCYPIHVKQLKCIFFKIFACLSICQMLTFAWNWKNLQNSYTVVMFSLEWVTNIAIMRSKGQWSRSLAMKICSAYTCAMWTHLHCITAVWCRHCTEDFWKVRGGIPWSIIFFPPNLVANGREMPRHIGWYISLGLCVS